VLSIRFKVWTEMSDRILSPAEVAAKEALAKVRACLDDGRSFRLEAGAGAGKTYSLVEALKYLIEKKGKSLLRANQHVACITYTNVASDQIASRIDRHPAIHSSTIHAFCWSVIKDFQPHLRQALPSIPAWAKKLAELPPDSAGIGTQEVTYDDRGQRRIEPHALSLYHDDVLALTVKLLASLKFRRLLTARYPILLIDEYQDTDKGLADALATHFLGTNEGPLMGFFGDHWQKIYGTGCGTIEHSSLVVIGKGSNFRSVPAIVRCLNKMRPDLQQQVVDEHATGSVAVYHTNAWAGTRRKGQHWDGDLPADAARQYFASVKKRLADEGWDLSPKKTKVLMLTHKALAAEQSYKQIADVFERNDQFIKKEDAHIRFFAETFEPVCEAFLEKRFGHMFSLLGGRTPAIRSISDKAEWSKEMQDLLAIREKGTIGDVLARLQNSTRITLHESISLRELELSKYLNGELEGDSTAAERLSKLKQVPYQEMVALARFIDEKTPFATKHGVKGAEFENVLAIFGRGWNLYNFNLFLEIAPRQETVSPDDWESFELNRNLFYVICSRPIKRLAMLFTQRLSDNALTTLGTWFGDDAVVPLMVAD
jgi:DNA helicase II / ATP-dependent DNA helicase PcrA